MVFKGANVAKIIIGEPKIIAGKCYSSTISLIISLETLESV